MYLTFAPQGLVLKHWHMLRRYVTITQPPLEVLLRNCRFIGGCVEEIKTKVLGPTKGFDDAKQFIAESFTKENVYISICHDV